jgi:sugar phosphate permease
LLIALIFLTLREPARRGAGAGTAIPSFGAVLAHMRGQLGAYGLLIFGLCLQSIMWNGATFWIPEHLKRAYGWSSSEVAWSYGPLIAICGTAGGLTGGWIAGWLRDKGRSDSNVLIGVIAAAGACPFAFAAPLMPSGAASLTLIGMFLFMGAMPYGGAAAAFQEITPNRMRGQVSAVYLFWLNLAGIGLGSTLVALVTQHLYGGDQGLSAALSTVSGCAALASAVVLSACLAFYRRAQDENQVEAGS